MRIGIDLGGSKIEIIALDDAGSNSNSSKEIYRQRIATPQQDYVGTVQAVVELVRQAELDTHQTATVGIGIPGAISPATNLVKNANSVCLIGKPLKADLEQALQREIKIENDANCFVVSEATDGAAAGAAVVFGVIIGTGTGGGIAINGKPITGHNAIAGEWGHNPLPWPGTEELPGAKCYCGQHGCIETFLSGPGFVRDYLMQCGQQAGATDVNRAEQIISLVEAGDALALQVLASYERRLAKSLASIINVLDPDVIVLGGGMSNIQRLYQNVPALWAEYVFSDAVDTQLVAPRFGDASGVRGAAWLWPA